ncbi:MAG TPA: pseudouridine synthase [Usitatibacter sp.]|nr:pseudouridine synthase [Usitatibacter sp.]
MRDRPHPQHKLEWPGGVVPEWAKPQHNANKRRGKGAGARGDRNGGSSPSKRERLQKVMAQSGHGSRRNIEILIAQGHITINGQVAKLGDSVGPGDKVKLDGNLINLRYGEQLPRVLVYHKTAGEIVTRDDPQQRPTVFEKLPKAPGARWVSVGRLDFNTEGLLIFTTSGELANRLTHPRFEVEREYAVRVMGELTEEQHQKLLAGVDIDGELCKFDALEDRGGEGSNHWYHVILREGKNREVRRMMESVGLMVSRLMRVRFGCVELPGHVKRGMMKEMDEEQVQQLLNFAGMNEPAPAADGEAEVENELDNVGNRAPDPARQQERVVSDDIGNRFEAREAAPAPEPDGNRGTYGDASRPPQRGGGRPGGERGGERRPQAGKPFAFGKKRGRGGRGPQGEANGNVHVPTQGQGHAHPPHGQGRGQGQGQPHGQQGQQGQGQPHGQQGQPHGQQRKPHGKPPQQGGQGQQAAAGPGQGKPGRHRRHRNRNRNRGPQDGAPRAAGPATSGEREGG